MTDANPSMIHSCQLYRPRLMAQRRETDSARAQMHKSEQTQAVNGVVRQVTVSLDVQTKNHAYVLERSFKKKPR